MKKLQVITDVIDETQLKSIVSLSGFRHVINLRRVNGDDAHCDLPAFAGSYERLFDSLQGIGSMSTFLDTNPSLFIPSA